MRRTVLVCQNATCQQQGSEQVLAAFQSRASSEFEVEASGCLGECGSGPMVLILPEQVWYSHLQLCDVPVIVQKHLKQGKVVAKKLYPKFHPAKPIGIWIVSACLSLFVAIVSYWVISNQLY